MAAISRRSFTVRARATKDSKPSARRRISAPGRSSFSSSKPQVRGALGKLHFPSRARPADGRLDAVVPQHPGDRLLERALELRVGMISVDGASLAGDVHVPGHEHRLSRGEQEQQRIHGVAGEPADRVAALVLEIVQHGGVRCAVAGHPLGRPGLPAAERRRSGAQRAATMFTSLFGTTMTLRISLPDRSSLIRSCAQRLLLQLGLARFPPAGFPWPGSFR